MAVRVWTHPKHKFPAAIGIFFNLVATMFITLGVTGCTFRDSRNTKSCASLLDNGVICTDDHCFMKTGATEEGAGWQGIVSILGLTAMSINAVSVGAQIFVFWPMVMTNGVFNIVLRICALLEIVSGFIKFVTGFMVLSVQVPINKSFMKFMDHAIEMRIMPAGFILFSVIFSFLSAMLFILASDTNARGEPTYITLIDEAEKEQVRVVESSRKVSVYRPSSKPTFAKPTMGSSTSV